MAPKTGLRTEIIVSTVLLLAAALLFAGFLLVKLTERELFEERRTSLHRTARMIAAANPSPSSLPALLVSLSRTGDLVAWRLLDAGGQPVLDFASGDPAFFDDLPAASAVSREIVESVSYSSAWLPFRGAVDSHVDLAVAVGSSAGNTLQLRFSLESLVAQVHRAQRLMLVYVAIYGAVLSAFGIYVFNRNVVQPVRRLQEATAGVAAGDLTPIDAIRGPGEINELAADFNSMIAALQESRAETAAHIRSLEEANQALRQARDEVVRAEKMASVGHLAAGMAHEIGNPLAATIGYLNLLKLDLADAGQRDLVERSLAEAGRIDRLVRDLLDYATPARATSEPFDPLGAFREAVALLADQGALEGVEVLDRAPQRLGDVRMDRGRFLQICINLLLNARDAMPAGGTVTFAAAREAEQLLLSVGDSGAGMTPELLSRIFEPFYTTKDPGKGRGLGLAVCQRLVEEAGGAIEVRSAPGSGSTFTLRLPMAKETC